MMDPTGWLMGIALYGQLAALAIMSINTMMNRDVWGSDNWRCVNDEAFWRGFWS